MLRLNLEVFNSDSGKQNAWNKNRNILQTSVPLSKDLVNLLVHCTAQIDKVQSLAENLNLFVNNP